MTACKHANGRDWWIILGESDTNRYFRFLFSPLGLEVLEPQVIGDNVPSGLGQAVLSPDGNYYVRLNMISLETGNYLDFYSFDRCVGMLSNHFQMHYVDQAGAGGVAFSSNSQFLYVTSDAYVYQYDINASSVEASKEVVALYDGFQSPFWTNFYQAQLAPDGRIYICSSNGVDVMHVINSPNEKGQACDLQQHSLQLPIQNAFSMPNFPNFNLGALEGSPCDTLGVSNAIEVVEGKGVCISPNPAKDYVEVKLPSGQSAAMLTLYSATGQPVRSQRLQAGWSVVGLEGLAKGMYFWEVRDEGRVLGAGKLVKVE